jgi:hypothetical protein
MLLLIDTARGLEHLHSLNIVHAGMHLHSCCMCVYWARGVLSTMRHVIACPYMLSLKAQAFQYRLA